LQVGRQDDHNDRTQVQVHDPLVGTVFDRRFHIDFRIAIGGFGAIYHATHNKSGHQFALKILHARLANDPGVIARFKREGETLTRLRNPHTIIAYEMGEADDGTLFIVLELLHGESLFERFRARGAFEWRALAQIARGVCHSLEEAHGLGIVHRDLKPTNINLERKDGSEDFVKVLDFGIAKILRDSSIDSADLTSAGQMIGTLDYMSPEQMVGGATTGQTDIYTLGIVMYEMIAGRRPFAEANSPAAVLAAMLRTRPDPLSSLLPVPRALDRIVMRCLEREPQHRWVDVMQLGAAIDRLLDGDESGDDDDVTRSVSLPPDDESTMYEERPRPLVTSPYPAQMVKPSAAAAELGEAATEPAPYVSRSKTISQVPPPGQQSRGSQPMLTTLPGRGAPGKTPTPVTQRKSPTEPPPAGRASQPAVGQPPGGRASQPLFGQAQEQSGGLATPLPGSGLALFPPPPPGDPRGRPPTPPPPMAVYTPPGAAGPLPQAQRPVMDLASFAQPAIPRTDLVPPLPPGPGMPGFDMSQIAARDAAVRRFVWIIVLAVAAVIGIAVATQL
jgi:serine/threonine-protein kinase